MAKAISAAQLQADDGHDRHQRVLQRMAEMDGAVGQPARAGELDVVGAQHFEHLRAHQPHDQRELEDGERHRRQDDVMPALGREQAGGPPAELHGVAAAEAGEPAEQHGEHQDQQDADQEGGQRHAQQGDRQEHLAQEAAAPQRRIHAHGNADQQRQRARRPGPVPAWPGKRSPIRRETLAPWRRLRPNSPCAALTRKCQNCTKKGWSSPRSARSCADLVGFGVLPEQEDHRVADILEQQERDERDCDHDDHSLEQAAQDKGEHRIARRRSADASRARAAPTQGFPSGLNNARRPSQTVRVRPQAPRRHRFPSTLSPGVAGAGCVGVGRGRRRVDYLEATERSSLTT